MTDAFPVPTDENLRRWLMGDETSTTRMAEAMSGPAGSTHREMFASIVPSLWGRNVLPFRATALMNMAILACLNRPFELYTRTLGLLRGGISVEEIQEVILHVNFYAGNPAGVEATVALHQAMHSLEERGIPFNHKPVAS